MDAGIELLSLNLLCPCCQGQLVGMIMVGTIILLTCSRPRPWQADWSVSPLLQIVNLYMLWVCCWHAVMYESAVGGGSFVHMLLLNCKKTEYSTLEKWWITHLLIIADWLWCPTSNIGSCSSQRKRKEGFLIISTNIAHGSSTSLDIYHMFAQLEKELRLLNTRCCSFFPQLTTVSVGILSRTTEQTNVSRYDKVTNWSTVLIKRFWHMFNGCMN